MNQSVNEILISPQIDLAPLRKIVKNEILPNTLKYDKMAYFNDDLYMQLHAMGVLTSIVPKHLGGAGLPVSDLIWISREIGYGSAGCCATFIGNLLGLSSVVMYAEDSLKTEVCAEYLKNYSLWSFAMTEAGAGSDLMCIETTSVETQDGFILKGEKNYITNATVSRQMCVFAKHIGLNGEDYGISCFFVRGNASGLSRGPIMDKIGFRESNTGTLYFDNVYLEKNCLLGKKGEGLGILTHCLNRSKTLLAATSVGVSHRALEITQDRLFDTVRFGKKLLDQSAIRHILARLHTQVEAAWLLTCQAAAVWDHGLPAVKESSMAKLFAGKTGVDVARETMELFGARGFFNDYEISKLYRDTKAVEIIEGPSLVQELLISKHVLKRKKEQVIDKYEFKNQVEIS